MLFAVVRWAPSSSSCASCVMGAGAAVVVRWSPEQQIWRKSIEAVEVMGPDELNAGSGSGWMGGAGDSSRDGLCASVRAFF